jgi:hypothetical protein
VTIGPSASSDELHQAPGLPSSRGPLTEALFYALRGATTDIAAPDLSEVDVLEDDDAQLALTCCYELHYESFAEVADDWEWQPSLIRFRNALEHAFIVRLVDEIGLPAPVTTVEVGATLRELADADGPSVSSFMLREGRLDQMREFCVHRAEYQLKEADPHTWALPRLRGRGKAAAVEIQYDEYGRGDSAAMHAQLFTDTLDALGLESRYGAYRDRLPATTLATANLVTLFGLHRRWRGACMGHLALFEMTSVVPMQRYADALRRFGVAASARRFYEAHVVADAEHELLAQFDLVTGLLAREPELAPDIVFGARALVEVERRMAEHLLAAWRAGQSSLRLPRASGRAA